MLSPIGIAYIYGFWAALPLACLAAWRWGAWPERSAGLLYVAALITTNLALRDDPTPFAVVPPMLVAIDTAVALALVGLAMRSDRSWLIWAASFQLIATIGHLSKVMMPDMSRLAYGLMEGASGWPVLLSLVIGIWQRRRRGHRSDVRRS